MDRSTAVLIPAREKLSRVFESLDAVLACTTGDFHVYVVDVGYHPSILTQLETQAAATDNITIVRGGPGPILSNAALNLAFAATREPLVCVVENDVVVSPGYWEPMAQALLSGAYDLVSPTIWDGRAEKIHFDPPRSLIEPTSVGGHRSELVRRPKDGWERVSGTRAAHHLEKHAFAGTRAAFEQLMPMDEKVFTRTDIDLSLSAFDRRLRIGICPESDVTFWGPPLAEEDRDFFAYRWDLDRVREGNDHVVEKWKLEAGEYLHFAHEMRAFL